MAISKQNMLLSKIEFDNYLIGENGQPVKQYRVGIVKPAKVTNSKIIKNICDHTGYPRAQVKGVLDSIAECVNDYLELGATVELENFMTIKPLIKVKAVMDKADATAATIKTRSIRCIAIGDFADMAKAWGFQLRSGDVAKGEASDDDGGVEDTGESNTPGTNPGNEPGGTTTSDKCMVTFQFHDGRTETREYEKGSSVYSQGNVPENTPGYEWIGQHAILNKATHTCTEAEE